MTNRKRTDLADPRVVHAHRTCARCPEEYVGRLVDGRWFYFAYRWGRAHVGIGYTVEDAIDDRSDGHDHGGVLDGEWPDTTTRDKAFRDLLTEALTRAPEPERHPPCPACESTNVSIADNGTAVCLDCRQPYLADT
jgi:hypothetical protein